MKRLCALLLCTMLLFAGCAGEAKTVDLTALAEELKPQYQDELLELTDSTLTEYYALDTADLKGYVAYKSAGGATAEEMALFEAVDSDAAARVKQAVDTRLEDLKFNFENYNSGEMTKLNSAVIVESGNYVFFVTVNDDTAARAIIEEASK